MCSPSGEFSGVEGRGRSAASPVGFSVSPLWCWGAVNASVQLDLRVGPICEREALSGRFIGGRRRPDCLPKVILPAIHVRHPEDTNTKNTDAVSAMPKGEDVDMIAVSWCVGCSDHAFDGSKSRLHYVQ